MQVNLLTFSGNDTRIFCIQSLRAALAVRRNFFRSRCIIFGRRLMFTVKFLFKIILARGRSEDGCMFCA